MSDVLTTIFPWVKALHVIAVISWMAGLLYLPRLMVYHVERGTLGSEISETFKVMEGRLLRVIMTPAMMVAWVCGLLMLFTPGIVDFGSFNWIYIKLAAVVGMSVFHEWLGKRVKEFANDANTRSSRTYRLMNEVPTVLMIVIVVMVIARPF